MALDGTPVSVAGIILAAGKGTRMKSDVPKVLHRVGGVPMLERVFEALHQSGVQDMCVILNSNLKPFKEFIHQHNRISICIQEQQQGTADAVASSAVAFSDIKSPAYNKAYLHQGGNLKNEFVLICYGDMPALKGELLQAFMAECLAKKAEIGVIGMKHPRPLGYGRLVLDSHQQLLKVVEEKDADSKTKAIDICNTGIVFARTRTLFKLLARIAPHNAQKEYYLTDCFQLAREEGTSCHVHITDDYQRFDGVNDLEQLANIEARMAERP